MSSSRLLCRFLLRHRIIHWGRHDIRIIKISVELHSWGKLFGVLFVFVKQGIDFAKIKREKYCVLNQKQERGLKRFKGLRMINAPLSERPIIHSISVPLMILHLL